MWPDGRLEESLVLSGIGPPLTIPLKIGVKYIDRTNKAIYNSVGISLLSDWRKDYTAVASPNKNLIINGDLLLWERGTSFSSMGYKTYMADRFCYDRSTGVGRHNATKDTSIPTATQVGYQLLNSLKLTTDVIQTSFSSGDRYEINYGLDGYDIRQVMGKEVTLSFWVKAFQAGTYCLSFYSGTADRSYVTEYTINSSDVWEKKVIILTMDALTDWATDEQAGLFIGFTLATAGSVYTTANKDVWQTGSFIATANQVNGLSSLFNNFSITNVQFEHGAEVTGILPRTISEEIQLATRYFDKVTFANGQVITLVQATTSTIAVGALKVVKKRYAPSVNDINSFSGSFDLFSASGTSITVSSTYVLSYQTPDTATISVTASGGGLTQGEIYRFRSLSGTAYFNHGAEHFRY